MLGLEVMLMDAMRTGQLIAQRRKEKGITQKELAEHLHVTTQAVSKWERGLNFPDIALLEPLAGCLDLTVSQLLSGSREEDSAPEELMTESLRTFDGQWRKVLRRWRWLFVVTAAALILTLLTAVWLWMRMPDDPPQPRLETFIEMVQPDKQAMQMAQMKQHKVFMYDVTLADAVSNCQLWIEEWGHEGLVKSGRGLSAMWFGEGPYAPRKTRLTVTFRVADGEEPKLEWGFSGFGRSPSVIMSIPQYEGNGYKSGFVGDAGERITVPHGEEGIILGYIGLNGVQGVKGTGATPEFAPGETCILLRMTCQ